MFDVLCSVFPLNLAIEVMLCRKSDVAFREAVPTQLSLAWDFKGRDFLHKDSDKSLPTLYRFAQLRQVVRVCLLGHSNLKQFPYLTAFAGGWVEDFTFEVLQNFVTMNCSY